MIYSILPAKIVTVDPHASSAFAQLTNMLVDHRYMKMNKLDLCENLFQF